MSAAPYHYHNELASGRWLGLSLCEQMGNIGSEVHRAVMWRDRSAPTFEQAISHALELMDLTIQDARWRGRLKEIVLARECLRDAMSRGEKYAVSLEDLDEYFLQFAIAARL